MAQLQTQLSSVIAGVSGLLEGIGVTVCILGIVVGGLMRATAFGNERRIAISNQAIACAVIGLAIVLLASVAGPALASLLPAPQ